MQEQINALRALAEVDNEIYGLREIKSGRPKQLEPFKAQATQKDAKLQFLKDELKRTRMASDAAENEIRSKEDKIGKLQVQLNSVKTNAEFQVLKEQIAKVREEVGALEEKGLGYLAKIEQINEELKRVKDEAEEAQKEFRAAEKEVGGEVTQIDARLKDLLAAREQAVKAVDGKYLGQYQRVLERQRDRAIVPVENGTCQGCFMSITAQTMNTLMMGSEVVTCKNCQRILYLAE
jgi:uncharacterized protein